MDATREPPTEQGLAAPPSAVRQPGEDEDAEFESFMDAEAVAWGAGINIRAEAKPRRRRTPGRPLPLPKHKRAKAKKAKETETTPDTPIVSADMLALADEAADESPPRPPSPPSPRSVFVNLEALGPWEIGIGYGGSTGSRSSSAEHGQVLAALTRSLFRVAATEQAQTRVIRRGDPPPRSTGP